jgi:hypothetical protein
MPSACSPYLIPLVMHRLQEMHGLMLGSIGDRLGFCSNFGAEMREYASDARPAAPDLFARNRNIRRSGPLDQLSSA